MFSEESHTLSLIEEAFEKVQEFNYKAYTSELYQLSQSMSNKRIREYKYVINRILENFGLHLMHRSLFEELVSNSSNKFGKWSSVGTLQLALKSPEKFDEIYNILSDEESKSIFDWFIKYRVAYGFLGEFAREIFPSPISKEEFLEKMNQLEPVKHSSLINVGGYYLDSEESTIAQSWIFKQYELNGRCEVSVGDYVIDGGAFYGETSFWFLSKGAGKIYAFEPDPNSFLILVDNIKRNKVSDKIIPVQKILSNRIGTFSFYTTGGGGSKLDERGDKTFEAITLDSFYRKKGLERVDFIKLDVEGAELNVLKGAVEAIKKFKPKMAVSVYHKPEDIITIPKLILEIFPDAKFYLSHKFYSLCETIIFINPRDGKML